MYDSAGKIIHWLVVTDDSHVPADYAIENNLNVTLLRSPTGRLNSIVVKNALIYIKR